MKLDCLAAKVKGWRSWNTISFERSYQHVYSLKLKPLSFLDFEENIDDRNHQYRTQAKTTTFTVHRNSQIVRSQPKVHISQITCFSIYRVLRLLRFGQHHSNKPPYRIDPSAYCTKNKQHLGQYLPYSCCEKIIIVQLSSQLNKTLWIQNFCPAVSSNEMACNSNISHDLFTIKCQWLSSFFIHTPCTLWK